MTEDTLGDSTLDEPPDAGRRSDAATVLLTEDDDAFRETERLWLAREPRYVTQEAANGEEALAALDASVDVLVLDLNMPLVSGLEVVARLDETEFVGDVVVVSASRLADDPDDDDRLDGDRVDATLDKPVGREQFVATLDRYVQ